MNNTYAVADHWGGGFDEDALQAWARQLRARLLAPRVSLGLVFVSPRFFAHAAEVLEIVRVYAQVPLLAGCSGTSLIAGDQEVEDNPGIALGLYFLLDAELRALHITQEQVEAAAHPGYWHERTGLSPERTNGWLAFVEPFRLNGEAWLQSWSRAFPAHPVLGGLASGDPQTALAQVYLNGEVHEEGGVAVSFGGGVKLASVISQGCTPIGETWAITKTQRTIIHQIARRPAYEVLMDTFNRMSVADREKTRGNLLVGLAMNEHLHEFHRGDFLIRNLLAADPRTGDLEVAAWPRPGQTLQFQRRDAAAATEDLDCLLDLAKLKLAGQTIYGACLCSCNGRGQRLFGIPSHDVQHVRNKLGPLGLAGFFCNGEIGPVGERNYVHGYTASLALFVKR